MGSFLDYLPACVFSWIRNPRHIRIQGDYHLCIMDKAQRRPHQLTTEQMDAQAGTTVNFFRLSLLLK